MVKEGAGFLAEVSVVKPVPLRCWRHQKQLKFPTARDFGLSCLKKLLHWEAWSCDKLYFSIVFSSTLLQYAAIEIGVGIRRHKVTVRCWSLLGKAMKVSGR